MKEPLVYIDGSFYPRSKARISVMDHGFLYGDGVFEGVRVYDGLVFKLREHIDRLYSSALYIRLKMPMTKEELTKAIVETLKRNGLRDAYIRLIVTRGYGDLGLDPRKCKRPSVIIIAEPVEPLHGLRAKAKGISSMISSVRRDAVDATTHEAKSLNYLNSILAKLEANEAGVEEAIMLDTRGFVSEASAENIFIVKDGKIITPPLTAAILAGVTRQRVLRLARELGYEVVERDITPFELVSSDEVFLTGTLSEIVPVVKINGRTIGEGKAGSVTKHIMSKFSKITSSREEGVYAY